VGAFPKRGNSNLLGRQVGNFLLLFLITVWIAGCSRVANQPDEAKRPATHPTIVFMTDFGTANDAVAICKAVILRIEPNSRIMDITHQVTPFSIEEGARFLGAVSPYYPAGTVFLVVVDPGVGSPRKAIVVKSRKGQFFVLPDNGLITPVQERDGIESAREITNPAWMIGDKVSSTFHGRDIFSPAAAHLAAGEDWTLAGPEVKELVKLNQSAAVMEEKGIQGEVIGLDDPFGNLITNVLRDDFKMLGYAYGEKVAIQIGGKNYTIPYAKTFADVPMGQPLLYIDSRGRISIALNQGDFAATYKIAPVESFFIPRKGR
jgi:hypothetical protein